MLAMVSDGKRHQEARCAGRGGEGRRKWMDTLLVAILSFWLLGERERRREEWKLTQVHHSPHPLHTPRLSQLRNFKNRWVGYV
jgi:hypothetical protein